MVSKDSLPFRVFCTSSDLRNLFIAGGYNLPSSPNSIKLMEVIDAEIDQNEAVNEETDENHETDSENEELENADNSFDLLFSTSEINLAIEYTNIIKKVRKIVKLFKKSPTKNDLLQTYMTKDLGKNITLLLDCKTRWSSLADMLTTFNQVRLCVSKALVDLGLGANTEYLFTEEEYNVLMDLEKVLQPVKLAVEVLCRRESNLITAEATLRFVVHKLEDINTPLAQKFVMSLRKRISERRTNMTAVLLYLHDLFKYEEDRVKFMRDTTFNLPSKNVIRREMKNIIEKLQFTTKENLAKTSTSTDEPSDDPEHDIPLASLVALIMH